MNENGQKISKLCVVGLILSILSAVLFWGGNILSYIVDRDVTSLVTYVFIIPSFVLPVPGLILSIAGLNSAKRKGKRGSAAGVTGIVLSALEIFLLVFCFVFLNNYLKKANTTPPDYTIQPHNSDVESVESILDSYNILADNTESTAST